MSELRLLSLDTSGETFSLALTQGSTLVAESLSGQPRSHLVQLFPQLVVMLQQAGWSPQQLDGVAVTVGPGSFTGLRTGLLLAKSLGQSLNLPCYGVDTLEALACNLFDCPNVVACLDARKGEVAWAHFAVQNGLARPLSPQRLDSPAEFARAVPAQSVVLGGGCQPALEFLRQRSDLVVAPADLWRVRASSLARQARTLVRSKAASHWSKLRPEYVRPADVQVHRG
jgi:tRNA threonylcarbamoyladenosine biosynthesis protein TsaB